MKVAFWALAVCALYAQVISEWAFEGPDHRLHYRPDTRGNTIMDFSSAGYRAGGVRLPSPPVVQRLTPVAGDNTARIQAALDQAAGTVLLAGGDYEIAGTLRIARSGVVLRGEKGAVIHLTGTPHRFLEIRGAGTWQEVGPPVSITQDYVTVGYNAFRVRDGSVFHSGDRVLVLHPVTAEWLKFVGLEPSQAGIHAGSVIRTDRVVDYVEGSRVTLDVSLSDALDSHYTSASLVHYTFPGRISEVGVEGLRIMASFDVAGVEPVLWIDAVEDGWFRDLDLQDTQNGIAIGPTAKRLTLANIRVSHSAAQPVSDPPADFALQGTQILVDRCRVAGHGTWPVVTDSAAVGPIAVLNFTAEHGGVSPREPWATGLLVDAGKFPGATERNPGISFYNRSAPGSPGGWAIAWSVAWNVTSPFLLVPQPPGALNWCVGCIGTPVAVRGAPSGIFDSSGKMVEPPRLYLHQLRDRIGPEALKNIGY